MWINFSPIKTYRRDCRFNGHVNTQNGKYALNIAYISSYKQVYEVCNRCISVDDRTSKYIIMGSTVKNHRALLLLR